jgi:IS605 OrfB family transposase
VSIQGNWLKSKVFYCHELEYASTNKRENIIGETEKQMFEWFLEENVGAIVLENITLRQQHESNKRFNRQTHTFCKTKLTQTILRRAMRMGFDYKFINPAYTSVIGRFKYSKLYGISVHEAASFVIGDEDSILMKRSPKKYSKYYAQRYYLLLSKN